MKKGFTLIEILVVMAIFFTVGVVAIQLFFSSLMGGTKSTVSGMVKENGDYALTVMERMIRNAREVELTTCTPSSLTIEDAAERKTTFRCEGANPTRIASASATTTYYLTSSSVNITCANLFTCTDKKIGISFTVAQYLPGVTPKGEETSQMDFRTTVTIRNY